MTETEQEVFARVCKTGNMTKPLTVEEEGLTPEQLLESRRYKTTDELLETWRVKR